MREIVKIEKCPDCHNESFIINHYLRDGHHDRIYLECSKCGELASRLIVHAQLAPNSYKSFLYKMARLGDMDPRKIMENYKIHEERAIKQFDRVKSIIQNLKNANNEPDTTITELYSDYNIVEDDQ